MLPVVRADSRSPIVFDEVGSVSASDKETFMLVPLAEDM
jgi:hypothetical protein